MRLSGNVQVLADARWLAENYDEQRSAQFLPAPRVRAICEAIEVLDGQVAELRAANRVMYRRLQEVGSHG